METIVDDARALRWREAVWERASRPSFRTKHALLVEFMNLDGIDLYLCTVVERKTKKTVSSIGHPAYFDTPLDCAILRDNP
jgi:hypothetical protein